MESSPCQLRQTKLTRWFQSRPERLEARDISRESEVISRGSHDFSGNGMSGLQGKVEEVFDSRLRECEFSADVGKTSEGFDREFDPRSSHYVGGNNFSQEKQECESEADVGKSSAGSKQPLCKGNNFLSTEDASKPGKVRRWCPW